MNIRVVGMGMDRRVVRGGDQRKLDSEQMADWVNWLAPWQIIAHLTFKWPCSLDSGRRVYERFMARHLPHLSYFYALEQNPSREGFHVHALWADSRNVFRKEAWAAWFTRYGRARIEPVRNYSDVSGYCSKYVTKERSWWNYKLQWHRLRQMHGPDFKLEWHQSTAPATRWRPSSKRFRVRDQDYHKRFNRFTIRNGSSTEMRPHDEKPLADMERRLVLDSD